MKIKTEKYAEMCSNIPTSLLRQTFLISNKSFKSSLRVLRWHCLVISTKGNTNSRLLSEIATPTRFFPKSNESSFVMGNPLLLLVANMKPFKDITCICIH